MIQDWKKLVGGIQPTELDPRDYIFPVSATIAELPETYHNDKKYYVHDQGSINNCAAHALSSYIEILLMEKNKFKEVSFPWYYGNRNYTDYKDQGLMSRDLLKTAQKDGGLYLVDYPFVEEMPEALATFNSNFSKLKEKAKNIVINNYYQCTTVQQIKEAIMKYGSCLVGSYLFESFGKVARGETLYMEEPIFNDDGWLEPPVGGHMMLITGWIKDYFVVQNSWGEEFGDKGYFYMPYSLLTWNQRTGFPISICEVWAIDGVYLDGKLTTIENEDKPDPEEKPTVVVPDPVPTDDNWYQTEEGKWHYKSKIGRDVRGRYKINGFYYYFDLKTADLITHKWIKLPTEKWIWLKDDGKLAIGWLRLDQRWYYFNTFGEAETGYLEIDNKKYYFAEQGNKDIKECQLIMTETTGELK